MYYIQEYYNKIKSGEILVGQEAKDLIERLINDLEDPRYIYDAVEVHKKIESMQETPLKLYQKALLEVAYSFKMASTGQLRFDEIVIPFAFEKESEMSNDCCCTCKHCKIAQQPGGEEFNYCEENLEEVDIFNTIKICKMHEPKE